MSRSRPVRAGQAAGTHATDDVQPAAAEPATPRFGAGDARARRRDWALRRAGAGRPWRHGRGLRRLRSGAGSQGRRQVAADQTRQRRFVDRGAPANVARGASDCPPVAPQRRRRLRRRHVRRSGVHRDGVRRGEHRHVLVAGPAAQPARGAARVPGRRARARRRARKRAGPSRLQARQRDGRARRRGPRHGLRAGAPDDGEVRNAAREPRRVRPVPLPPDERRRSRAAIRCRPSC